MDPNTFPMPGALGPGAGGALGGFTAFMPMMRAAAAELTQLLGTGEQSMLMAAKEVGNGSAIVGKEREGQRSKPKPSKKAR